MSGTEVATCSSRANGQPVVYEYMTNTNEKMPVFLAADFSAWFLASATGGGIVQWADVTRSCVDVQAAAADVSADGRGSVRLFDLLCHVQEFKPTHLPGRFRIYANVLWPSVRRRLSCRCRTRWRRVPGHACRRRSCPSIH